MSASMSKSKQILLLRHAKSSWADPISGDFSRPLNDRGRRSATAMGRQLERLKLRPQMILCSSAKRTRETYDGLGASVDGVPVEYEDSIYEASVDQLLNVLRGVDDGYDSVMMIGHNPGMEEMAKLLCENHGNAKALERMAAKFPTGALAVLETDSPSWDELGQGSCQLKAFMRPVDSD